MLLLYGKEVIYFMPKDTQSQTKLVHYVCAALLLILLVMQFTPFWHYGEAGDVATSISGYIWFPGNHADLTSYLQATISEDFIINDILIFCILMLVLSAVGLVLCAMKPGTLLAALLPTACGLSGVIGFLAEPALRLGSTWGLMFLLCLLMLCGGAYTLYTTLQQQAQTA